MIRKNILGVSLLGVLLFLISIYSVEVGICERNDYYCRKTFDIIQNVSGVFPLIFLFSLITYKMREEVFRGWWNFARWFIPVIIGVSFLQNTQMSGGGVSGVIGRGFDIFVLSVLYGIFAGVSFMQIFRTWRKFGNEDKSKTA